MADRAKDAVGDIPLGPFEVKADQGSISAFAAALGQAISDTPAIFPIVWLSAPALKQKLRSALGPGHLPIHETQSFDYEHPLTPGRYRLSGVARRECAPDRLIVTMQAIDGGGRTTVVLRSVLRIVTVSGSGMK